MSLRPGRKRFKVYEFKVKRVCMFRKRYRCAVTRYGGGVTSYVEELVCGNIGATSFNFAGPRQGARQGCKVSKVAIKCGRWHHTAAKR
jgi:hypothetical protein